MLKLSITNKDDKVFNYIVNECNLTVYEEGVSWRLKMKTDKKIISYLIHKDTRETFESIKDCIESLKSVGEINIREYPDRDYIYISGNDEVERQFSGQREQ